MSVESAFEIAGPSLPPDLMPQELVVRESVNAPFVLRALGNRVEKKCVAGESVSLTGPEGGLYAVLEARVGDKVIPLRTIEREKSNV